MIALPHIRPTLARAGAGCATLKAIGIGTSGRGFFNTEQIAQTREMKLIAGAFFEGVIAPLGDEGLGGHHCCDTTIIQK